jgi:hypothetical protein
LINLLITLKIANTNALVIFFLIIVTQIILIEINKVEIVSKTTILPCPFFLNNSKINLLVLDSTPSLLMGNKRIVILIDETPSLPFLHKAPPKDASNIYIFIIQ